jgi:hypothetical protein
MQQDRVLDLVAAAVTPPEQMVDVPADLQRQRLCADQTEVDPKNWTVE